ncbi:MAG: DegV family protein [Syntrophomonadaceae bacterium]|mgnify:FL=1|nr:DegV family protein [Syntrophomonadaceae bacterium]
MATIVVTDSSCHIPACLVEEFDIRVVPFYINMAGEEFLDNLSESYQEFYQRQRKIAEFPTTSQPSVGDFVKVFNRSAPGDNIITILMSSALSGALQSANMARELFKDRNIEVLDSLSSSLGLGFQVLKACESIRSKRENILEEVASVRDRLKLFFLVDSLDNLVKSGRLPKAVGMLGNLLNIKAILTVSNGCLQLYDKARSKRKGMRKMVSELEMATKKAIVERVGIAHVDAAVDAEYLKEMIEEVFPGGVLITEAGPAVGLHIGSGGLALVYY